MAPVKKGWSKYDNSPELKPINYRGQDSGRRVGGLEHSASVSSYTCAHACLRNPIGLRKCLIPIQVLEPAWVQLPASLFASCTTCITPLWNGDLTRPLPQGTTSELTNIYRLRTLAWPVVAALGVANTYIYRPTRSFPNPSVSHSGNAHVNKQVSSSSLLILWKLMSNDQEQWLIKLNGKQWQN